MCSHKQKWRRKNSVRTYPSRRYGLLIGSYCFKPTFFALGADGSCPTVGGNVCKFPFTHNGVKYDGCMDGGLQGKVCSFDGSNQFDTCSDDPAHAEACRSGQLIFFTDKLFMLNFAAVMTYDGNCLDAQGKLLLPTPTAWKTQYSTKELLVANATASSELCLEECRRWERGGSVACEYYKNDRKCMVYNLRLSKAKRIISGDGNNKFYSVERMRRHLYSFNSCVLYTWVSLEALNNLYELPVYKPNSPSLWFDL